MTPEVVGKLHNAFAIGATVEEACRFAGVNRDSFYEHIKKDEGFSDEIEGVKDRPILKSKSKMAVELSPGYVTVALQRYEDATGVKPTRVK
jgi:hypothetical protein